MTSVEKSKSMVEGRVLSRKMDKTAIVVILRRVQHKAYKKYITLKTKLFIDDPENLCSEGDWVQICQVRPISANKSWKLVKILEKAKTV